jgi:hypothetical protein
MSKKINHQFHCSRMMLPEHCSVLREHSVELERKENFLIPNHDEQQLEECQQLLEQALADGLELSFMLVTASGREAIRGVPLRFEQYPPSILVSSVSQGLIRVDIEKVISVKTA